MLTIIGPARVFTNTNPANYNFLNVRLPSDAQFVNAKIWLTLDDGRTLFHENIQGGVGFGGDQSETHTFGLGRAKPSHLRVETIYGEVYETDRPPKVNSLITGRMLSAQTSATSTV